MSLNIPNLDKLIAHLEAQPPERINMGYMDVAHHGSCGTCGCIAGHAALLEGKKSYTLPSPQLGEFLGLYKEDDYIALAAPRAWYEEQKGSDRYPAHRVIATLKRLRDRFLATGEIVVDWGPEPGEEPAQAWSAPQAVETKLTPPALPEELTRLLTSTPQEA